MKNTSKITLSAMMAALSTVIILLSYFPYLTFAVPAIAGLFIMVIVLEIDCKWAFASYIVSSFLIFLVAEPECKLIYICFLGYYPILKALIERINKSVFEWILKLIIFNAAIFLIYSVFAKLFGINNEDIALLGKFAIPILLFAANFVFVLYDIAISRISTVYFYLLHNKIKKMFKI